MVTLYHRATPSQQRILRAVEGAIKNAQDAHPNLKISPRHRRSIAKRAAGTLTAQWPEVLASAPRPASAMDRAVSCKPLDPPSSDLEKASDRGASQYRRRAPLTALRIAISRQLGAVKRSEEPGRADGMIDVLRMISALEREGSPA